MILVGFGVIALVLLVSRMYSRRQTKIKEPIYSDLPEEINPTNDAVLFVQAGGKVLYTNFQAREWFQHHEEAPNLEHLARSIRPSEVFLGLCGSPGQARFSLNGRLIDGISYEIPAMGKSGLHFGGGEISRKVMLVALRKPQTADISSSESGITGQAQDFYIDLSKVMASSLDLEKTLQAILESTEHLVPSDAKEITIWDPHSQNLTPYRFVGTEDVDRHIEMDHEHYSVESGFSGFLATQRQLLSISDVDTFREIEPSKGRKHYPYSSYMGVPLQIAGELVGTLELASFSKEAFNENDQKVLTVLAGQAAAALKNALLFQEEQQRILELSGLAKLAQVVEDSREAQDLYRKLVESISPLLDVKTLGFLIYQESQRLLIAQKPFVGIPIPMLDFYHVIIQPGTAAEDLWLSGEMILAQNAPEDPRLEVLGLNHMAQAAGIQNTILIPLASAGRLLGYLQIADKKNGRPFNQDDLRILTILSSQVATIIENATLVKESQERVQRSEALRRVASLAASVATLDEILIFSLKELARLLRVDVGLIYLLDENIGELRLHKESLFGISEGLISHERNISMTDSLFHNTVTASQNPLMTNDVGISGENNSFYAALENDLQVVSIIVVPLIVQNQGVGEIFLGSRTASFFDRNDLTLVSTTASQLSTALEKSILIKQSDESLQRQVVQLLSLLRVSREMNATLDLERLLQIVYDEALRTTKADCGSISLFNLNDEERPSPRIMMQIGDPSNGQISLLEEQVVTGTESIILEEYGFSELSPEIEVRPPHKGVQSSLIVPITFQGKIAGLIHLHTHLKGQFDETSVEIVQSLAVQAAIALGIAQRYQEQKHRTEFLNHRVETMATLVDTSRSLLTGQPFEQSLESIAFGIQDATPFSVVLISVYESEKGNLLHKAAVGIPLERIEELEIQPQAWSEIQGKLKTDYLFSRSYLIPGDGKTFWPPEPHYESMATTEMSKESGQLWHSDDLCLVPMLDASGNPLGLIQVDAPRDGKRPDRPTIETLEIFANQACLVIERFMQVHELSTQTTSLQQELERSQSALQSIQGNLPVLLHKDLTHTISIQRLNQRTRRMRAGLDIIELINKQSSRNDVLSLLGQELLTRMDMDVVLIAEPSEGGLHLLYEAGALPQGVTPQALLGQRNPLRACIQSGEPIFVSNLDENAEWKGSPLLSVIEAKAFICIPILLTRGESSPIQTPDSTILAVSNTPLAEFTSEDEHIFSLLSQQVGEALGDLEMIKEMNRRLQEVNLLLEFSRQLGTLDTAQILKALLDNAVQAIPAANAGMVALWSDQRNCLVPQCAVGYVDPQKILKIPYASGEALPGQVYEQGQPMRIDEVDFALHYNLPTESLLLYRDATEGRLPVSSLIIPLQTFDTKLGVLVLDNFKSPGAFSGTNQALATSLARQTALTLENVRLYQASEQRSAQLQALTDVAGTITSSLQVNELISSLLDQVRSIIPFDTGTLWIRQVDTLTVRAALGFEDSEERIGLSVEVEDSLLLMEMITTSRPLTVGDVRADARFPSLVEALYLSWMGIPLLSKGVVIGVIALEKLEPNFYTSEHIQAMVTFAGQAAVALENAKLYEESVQRASELDDRSQRLALLNRVSTALSHSLDHATIFSVLTNELPQALPCSLVSVVTLDMSGDGMVRGQTPSLSAQLPLQIPQNEVFKRLRESLGIFTTEDCRNEPDLQPLLPYLEETNTHSLLIVPMASGSDLVGLALIHTAEPYRFSPEEVELARTICNQAGVAIQNARLFAETERLFAETQKHSTELSILYDLGVGLTQVLDESHLVDVTFENVKRLIKAESVIVNLVDEEGYMTEHVHLNGLRQAPVITVRQGTSFSEYVIQTNRSLLIPDALDEKNIPVPGIQSRKEYRSWLGVPLVARGTPAGVISVQSASPNKFDDDDLRLLRQIANQLSVSLDNAQLISQVQTYAADLERRVLDRTEQLEKEHRRIQTLLSIITELSASLDLDLVLSRTLAIINETIEAEHSVILLIQPDGTSLFLRASLGYSSSVPKGGQPSAIKAHEGLAGWVISNRQAVMVNDLWQDTRWVQREERTAPHRSALAVPLMVGEDILGVMMIFHRQVDRFTNDQLDLVQATAKQIAVAINNAQLYNLIRDQAERLGDMLRTQHVETSRSQAILEAVADGVLVTDARRQITLFNASAENILGLRRSDVVGHSLDHFIGLFGKAGQSWVQTIRTWSEDPLAYQPGDIFAEQIELDDRRVVSVRLSPVRLRSDFLGTVSIFRDITHEVEVDRLKSEFVATVSHELRTPMTSIKGYVDVMLMGASGQLNEQQKNFLEIVKSNTERLAILVNDLLDVSRIEAGKVTLSLQPLDMAMIADDIIASIKQRMKDENRPMEITKDIPGDLPRVSGDPSRVRQILDNLVENAYQYTPENGQILIRMRKTDMMVQVDVKDSGIGISPEEGERIFERFYRGEDPLVLATSGTGLGLSIVQTLVDMHQGRIWYESLGIPGQGSTFSFTLLVYASENVSN